MSAAGAVDEDEKLLALNQKCDGAVLENDRWRQIVKIGFLLKFPSLKPSFTCE